MAKVTSELCKFGPTCREKDSTCKKTHFVSTECKNPDCSNPRCAFTHSKKTNLVDKPKPKTHISRASETYCESKSNPHADCNSSKLMILEKNYEMKKNIEELRNENALLKEQIAKLKRKNENLEEKIEELEEELELFTEEPEPISSKKKKSSKK